MKQQRLIVNTEPRNYTTTQQREMGERERERERERSKGSAVRIKRLTRHKAVSKRYLQEQSSVHQRSYLAQSHSPFPRYFLGNITSYI